MYDIIIIGAGPAGISMGVEARSQGVAAEKILILEKMHEHSFSLKKYYPENKLVTANYKGFEAECTGVMCIVDASKNETISYLDQTIHDHQLHVQYSETVTTIHKYEGEQRFTLTTDKGSYDTRTIAIAIGILGKPNKPEYKLPPRLKDRTLFDLTSVAVEGSKVLVVGGGDSASEYCQYLVEKGNTVALSYRKSDFTRMNEINKKSLLALGERGQVEFLLGTNILRVNDANGRPDVVFSDPTPGARIFDFVVYALGGTTPQGFLRMIGIEFDGDDPFLAEGYETNVAGMFLIGDLSAGTKGGSIIWAFNSANTAMKKIREKYSA